VEHIPARTLSGLVAGARGGNGAAEIATVPAVGYTLVNRADPSVESFRGAFFKIRRALGTTAFGINEIRLPPGAEGLEHDESETGHEEVYIVIGGGGTFTIDGEAVPVVAGDYLRVDPDARRIVVAGDDGIAFVAVAGRPRPEYDGRPIL
jgi:quercetin dioxygenase-like cupin family protein